MQSTGCRRNVTESHIRPEDAPWSCLPGVQGRSLIADLYGWIPMEVNESSHTQGSPYHSPAIGWLQPQPLSSIQLHDVSKARVSSNPHRTESTVRNMSLFNWVVGKHETPGTQRRAAVAPREISERSHVFHGKGCYLDANTWQIVFLKMNKSIFKDKRYHLFIKFELLGRIKILKNV